MKLLCISPAAFEFVRKNLLPLPSQSYLYEKFKDIVVTPGLNVPAFEFLRGLAPKMDKNEELVTVMVDEMKIDEWAETYNKIDAVIGPHKYANQLLIKSILGDWELPIYSKFDSAITKKNLFRIIRKLESIGIKVMFFVCDQGPRNLTLAKKLGITIDNVSFPNPHDESREVCFAFDWVHAYKNLR